MSNFFAFLALLFLSLELCFSSTPKAMPPKKPTLKDEIIVQLADAAQGTVPFQCTTMRDAGHRENNKTINEEGGGWHEGFFVQVDSSFSEEEKAVINSALYEIHEVLCVGVHIWPEDVLPPGDYVYIEKGFAGSGCFSVLGKQGVGKQEINLGPGCVYTPVVIHECFHALGWDHEQCRKDRDEYVDIFWNNIVPGFEDQFFKNDDSTYDVPYDVHSILHYESYAFSKGRENPTILTKDGEIIPWNMVMTSSDVLKLQRMYSC